MADSCDYVNITLMVSYLLLLTFQQTIQFAFNSVLRYLEFRKNAYVNTVKQVLE
jgi:hypothetical protein